MASLARLRCITVDVTGTLIAYRGQLGDYYCLAAKAAGLACPDYERVHEGFKLAYKEMATKFPCFGRLVDMPNIEWWRTCVKNSFTKAGYVYDDETLNVIFKRIYASFGSASPYIVYDDAQPFLRWAKSEGIVIGIISNAEYRYRDVILPTLGLHKGSEWDFGVFSGIEGVEKPNPRIYEIALEQAGCAPDEALHIGDSHQKDYVPSQALGMHAILLDRFKTSQAQAWREAGVPVYPDLSSVRAWLSQRGQGSLGPERPLPVDQSSSTPAEAIM